MCLSTLVVRLKQFGFRPRTSVPWSQGLVSLGKCETLPTLLGKWFTSSQGTSPDDALCQQYKRHKARILQLAVKVQMLAGDELAL